MSQGANTPPNKPASKSLRELFPGFFPPSDDSLRLFLTEGLIVFDTNPLLDTYKLTGVARAEFLNTLRVLGDRLWIPHQVGLEFLRNRNTVISQGTGFRDKFRSAANDLHKVVQQLKEHRGLKDEEVSDIKQAIDTAITEILDTHSDLYAFEVEPGTTVDNDPVFKEIDRITAGKIGPPLSNLDEAKKIGAQRLKNKVPPGYSDVPDKGSDDALGDYFVWEQTLIEATHRQLPVLLVTNDSKEDWIRKEGSYRRGPRPELVEEMLTRAGQPFHLMNVRSFLFQVGKHLHTHISDSTIKQAESVQRQVELSPSARFEPVFLDKTGRSFSLITLFPDLTPRQYVMLRRILLSGETVSTEDISDVIAVRRALNELRHKEMTIRINRDKNRSGDRALLDEWRQGKLTNEIFLDEDESGNLEE
ncbi:DUF4935 domain-containing protein [Nonomuraea sp. NN258]|uniref:PIN-like domain-containing protein n=1 Tax=Nonomuraea antri TaxID=2730852 RepID=UPI00156883BF|nr:PIN-like domain-containing protein [Nonomuraea antri]NRQ31252.1 DUF4935 domain-containing protein [Nonomuraea antri]